MRTILLLTQAYFAATNEHSKLSSSTLAVLFSATFQKRVERLAREVMTDPVRISIGNVGQV